MTSITLRIAAAACSVLALATSAIAADQKGFYRDKTIRVVIGTAVGASYGVFGQLVSRHLGRFIPGGPSVILTSMPGAGGLVALNYLANVAPQDGTVISVIHVTLVQESLFNKAANFDARDFKWIGRMDSLGFVGLASKSSGVTSLDDARRKEVVVGSPGLNNVPAQAPLVLNQIAGTKFKLISGYKGAGAAFLALERGEIDLSVASLATMDSVLAEKMEKGELVPVFAQAGRRLSRFPDLPVLNEFAKDPVEKAFLDVFTLTSDIGRALAATPGVPDERLEILRAAYKGMMNDPEFKSDAKNVGLNLDPLSAEELEQLVRGAMDMKPDMLEKVKGFYDKVLKGTQ